MTEINKKMNGKTRKIRLKCGAHAVVDAEFETSHSFRLNARGYAVNENGRPLHDLVWEWAHGRVLEDGRTIDHADRNRLNNTIVNLREADKCQQSANRNSWGESRWKGVARENGRKGWRAEIMSAGVRRRKRVATELEAAKLYNEWAEELHGEFAVLNRLD